MAHAVGVRQRECGQCRCWRVFLATALAVFEAVRRFYWFGRAVAFCEVVLMARARGNALGHAAAILCCGAVCCFGHDALARLVCTIIAPMQLPEWGACLTIALRAVLGVAIGGAFEELWQGNGMSVSALAGCLNQSIGFATHGWRLFC